MKKFKLLSLFLSLLTLLLWVAITIQDTALAATAIPSGLTAVTYSSSQINLTWNKVTGATSYKVFRSIGTSAAYTQIASVTTPKYNNTGLKAGTRYNYRVKAVKGTSVSGFSAVKIAYTKPGVPTGLKAIGSSAKQINLTWTAVAGATSYQVFRSIGTSTSYTRIATVTTPKYNNTGLTLGKRYNYKVRTIGKGGTGSFCTPVMGYPKPSVPTGLSAARVNDTQIRLSWKAAAGATGYKVYVSANGGEFTFLAKVTSPLIKHTGLAAGSYRYKVTAVAAASESAPSSATAAVAVAGPSQPSLAAPTGVAATKISETQIRITWNAVAGATGYKVYISYGADYAYLTTLGAVLFLDHANLPAGSFSYKVSAVNGSIESSLSSATAVVAVAGPGQQGLPAPGNFSAETYNYQSVQLHYDVVQNAVKYRIYFSKIPSNNLNDYQFLDWSSKDCRVKGLDADTTYNFRVATIDILARVGVPTGFIPARTNVAPPLPAQPQFYLYNIEYVGTKYQMNFYRGTSPIYPTNYEPTFEFTVAYTQAGLATATPETTDMSHYYYYQITPGQSIWYGFKACYGPYKSTMQILHIAALGKPTNVTADGLNHGGYVNMSWGSVYAASKYNIYYCVGAPYPGQSWIDFKTSLNLQPIRTTSGTSISFNGVPLGVQYYFIVVPADANGVEGFYCNYAITGVIN